MTRRELWEQLITTIPPTNKAKRDREQLVSLVYGQVALLNPALSRDDVERLVDAMLEDEKGAGQ